MYHLSPAHLAPFRSDEGVECHVLGLEWSYPIAVLLENPAQTSHKDAFAHIRTGAEDHKISRSSHELRSPDFSIYHRAHRELRELLNIKAVRLIWSRRGSLKI